MSTEPASKSSPRTAPKPAAAAPKPAAATPKPAAAAPKPATATPKSAAKAPKPAAAKAPKPAAAAPSSAGSPIAAQPTPGSAAHGRRFKHRELELPDGGKLVLKADGSISAVDASGAPTQTWDPADPDWASHAIRFGLFPQDATVPPTGRFIEDRRPPRR